VGRRTHGGVSDAGWVSVSRNDIDGRRPPGGVSDAGVSGSRIDAGGQTDARRRTTAVAMPRKALAGYSRDGARKKGAAIGRLLRALTRTGLPIEGHTCAREWNNRRSIRTSSGFLISDL